MKNNIFKRICGIFAVAFMLSVLAPAAFAQVDLGVIGGAVLATNSAKARQIVRDGQMQVKDKVDELAKEQNKKN